MSAYDDTSREFEELYVPGIRGAKRLSVQHTPWMGDWFVSHSPRNGNTNAEGPWAHWVDLALGILQHEFTGIVRPELRDAVRGFEQRNFYDDADVYITDEQLRAAFESGDET